MDTLPSSVSSLKIPTNLIHRKSSDFSRFKPPHTTTTPSHQNVSSFPNSLISSHKPPSSFSQKATSNTNFTNLQSSSLKQSSLVHRNAVTGYAAALIDVAQYSNQLKSVEKDVKRFLKLLGNDQLQGFMKDPRVKESEKGHVVKEIAEKGMFHKHLIVLVKMLVDKTKLGMVTQVLMEFQRIFYELIIGTKRVSISS